MYVCGHRVERQKQTLILRRGNCLVNKTSVKKGIHLDQWGKSLALSRGIVLKRVSAVSVQQDVFK